jgi:hypothetical protein
MAVPKHKRSYMKVKRKYNINNSKLFINRNLLLNESEILYKMQRNDFIMPYYLMSIFSKKKRIKIDKIK